MARQGLRRINGHIRLSRLADAIDGNDGERKGRRRRLEALRLQSHARCVPKSAGSPLPAVWNPEMPGPQGECPTPRLGMSARGFRRRQPPDLNIDRDIPE